MLNRKISIKIENVAVHVAIIIVVYIFCCLLSALLVLENVRNIHSYWACCLLLTVPFQALIWSGFITGVVQGENAPIPFVGSCVLATISMLIAVGIYIRQDMVKEDVLSNTHVIFYSIELVVLLAVFREIKIDENKRRELEKESEMKAEKVFRDIISELKNGITVQECLSFMRRHCSWINANSETIYMSREEEIMVESKLQEYYKGLTEEEKERDNKAYHEYEGIKEYNPYLTEKSLFVKFNTSKE